MALSLSELYTLRDNLIRSITRGVKRVQSGANEVEYNSTQDMVNALIRLDEQIVAEGGVVPSSSPVSPSSSSSSGRTTTLIAIQ